MGNADDLTTDNRLTAEAKGPPASKAAAWLEQHGGYVLLVCGATLCGLATLTANRPAVAPIFAAFGCGLIVLGCFYSRIEGGVEASRDGVKTVVREIDRLAGERNVPADLLPAMIEAALDRLPASRSQTDDIARRTAESVVSEAIEAQAQLGAAFSEWLSTQGWSPIYQVGPSHDAGLDLIAKQKHQALGVVLLRRWGASAVDVRRAGALKGAKLMAGGSLETITDVAVVSRHQWDEMHPYTAQAASELGVRVYTVDDIGAVRQPLSPFAGPGATEPA